MPCLPCIHNATWWAFLVKNEGGVSWMLVCVLPHVFLRDSHTISDSGLKRPGNFRHLELLFTKFTTWEGFQKNLRRSNRKKRRFGGGEGKSPAIVLRKTGSPLRLWAKKTAQNKVTSKIRKSGNRTKQRLQAQNSEKQRNREQKTNLTWGGRHV